MTLRIAITGSSGMIGSHLVNVFSGRGHIVTPIIRSSTPLKTNRKVIRWDIDGRQIDAEGLEGHDVVIHLAGANIAQERWTERYKNIIEESRVKGTELLCRALSRLKKRPKVLLSASAIGYYGNASLTEKKDEGSPKGRGFLADVCERWERATEPAEGIDIRVVHMRLGMVLGKEAGALAKMLPIFKLGLGGKIGSGEQPISWISLEEIPDVIMHSINCETLCGPVNFVSPQVISNVEFTRILGEAIHRPTVFPLPSFAARLMFGDMADTLLLGGVCALPGRLRESGYQFNHPDLKTALTHIINK